MNWLWGLFRKCDVCTSVSSGPCYISITGSDKQSYPIPFQAKYCPACKRKVKLSQERPDSARKAL